MMRQAMMVGLLLLAACGGDKGEKADVDANPGAAEAPAGIDGATVSGPGDFNYADACTMLARDKVAEVMGVAVTGTELGTKTAATESTAGFSTCRYKLADGKEVSLLARWSPVAETDEAGVRAQRQAQEEQFGLATEDAAGVGDIAFWTPKSLQLNVFEGKQKYLIFGLTGTDKAKAKDRAIALAKAAGY